MQMSLSFQQTPEGLFLVHTTRHTVELGSNMRVTSCYESADSFLAAARRAEIDQEIIQALEKAARVATVWPFTIERSGPHEMSENQAKLLGLQA